MESVEQSSPAFEISQPDEFGVIRFGDMRLGLVDRSRLERRRDNPRAMSAVEYDTLKRSMERFGFKSFIVVEEISPGRYGVIDGHHRWQAAEEQDLARVPVVLLDADTDQPWADLAMLTFNVTGEPIEGKFIDLLAELTQTLGPETTAAFTALDPDFLANFGQEFDATVESIAKLAAPEDESKQHAWVGRPLSVEFPRDPNVQTVLETVCRLTQETVVGRAILAALSEWIKNTESAQDVCASEDHYDGDDEEEVQSG